MNRTVSLRLVQLRPLMDYLTVLRICICKKHPLELAETRLKPGTGHSAILDLTLRKRECFHYLPEQNCYGLKLNTYIIHILLIY